MGMYIEGLDKQVQKGAESITVTFWDKDELIINEYDIGDMSKVTDLDLVRCGECKYMKKYALRSDEPTGIWCHRWSIPRLVTDDDFCSYGERRADEDGDRVVETASDRA